MHSIRVKNCWNWLIRTRSKVKLDREQFLFIISFSTLICFLKTVYKHTYIYIYIHTHIYSSSVQFSHSVVSDSLQPLEPQHARPPCPPSTPRVYPNSCPSSRWCHPASHPLPSPSPPAPNPSQQQGLFQWVSSSHEVAKVLEFQPQHQSFQWTPRIDLL